MRIICFLVAFATGNCLLSQNLLVEKVGMSTGDAAISLEIAGNTSFYELATIATNGSVYTFDGRELKPWSDRKIKNVQFFEHIYINDSLLFASFEGKYYQFNQKSTFPVKLSKATVDPRALASWKTSSADQVNFFELKSNNLSWTNKALTFNTTTHVPTSRKPVISPWGTPYLIIDNALHKASPSPTTFSKDFLVYNNQKPTKHFTSAHTPYFAYQSSIFLPQFSCHLPLPQDIQSPNKILNILSPSPTSFNSSKNTKNLSHNAQQTNTPIILTTKDNIFLHINNQWTSINHKINPAVITAFYFDSETITLSTKNSGVYTASIPADLNNQVNLVPHKLNSKLKEFNFLTIHNINKTLYYFTEKSGVISTSDRKLRIIKTPSKVKQVSPLISSAILISDNGETFQLNEKNKSINKLDLVIPKNTQAIFTDSKNLFFKAKDSLATYNLATKKLHKIAYTLPVKLAFAKNSQVHNFIDNDLYSIYPTANQIPQAPQLYKAFIQTASDKIYEVFPSQKQIELTTDDYPITFLAEAKFLKNPASIEYQYSWKNPNVKKRSFSFNNSHTLRTKLIGIAQATLTLKSDEAGKTLSLAPIHTERAQGKTDYTAIIYAGIAIISMLLFALILGYFRSRKQKKKIENLINQQHLMEMEQKALQLQMNPHFIFNSLNGVKGMIALGKDKNAKEYLTKISGWMRNMLNDARKNKILVTDEVKNLSLYMDIEKELRGGSFTYDVRDETAGEIHIPSMMIQPFIENAIVHAFDGSQQDPHVSVVIQQKGIKAIVTIEDNGVGMIKKKVSHKSVAMDLIRERLTLWDQGKGSYGIKVLDKTVPEHDSTGVIIELTLPIMN